MKRQFIGLFISMLLLVAIFSVSATNDQQEIIQKNSTRTIDWWPYFRHDATNNGMSQSQPVINIIDWSETVPVHQYQTPIVVNDMIFLVGSDQRLYSLNTIDGSIIWGTPDPLPYPVTSPSFMDEKVFIGAGNNLYAFDAYSGGDPLWISPTAGMMKQYQENAPTVFDGKIYLGSGNKIQCFSADNGTILWSTTDYSGSVGSSPAISQGSLYASFSNKMYCFDLAGGTKKWEFSTDAGKIITTTPVAYKDKLYFGAYQNQNRFVYCININDGTLIWTYSPESGPGGFLSSPVITQNYLYFGAGANIYCLNATTSSVKWKKLVEPSGQANIYSSVIVAYGKVYSSFYTGNFINNTIRMNANTGEIEWKQSIPGHYFSSPALADGYLYVVHDFNGYGITRIGAENEPPQIPTLQGPTNGFVNVNYTYTATTTDPESNNISYMFDWNAAGSHEYSTWTPLSASGTPITMTHQWKQPGTYQVKVKAKDYHDYETEWSAPLTVIITIPLPKLEITEITGGKEGIITAKIKNIGDAVATNIQWDITITGGFIIFVSTSSGTISSLSVGEIRDITLEGTGFFGIGIGFGKIKPIPKITVSTKNSYSSAELSKEAKIFFKKVTIQ
ncbi:MAG: PQQ-binding-like beta-propeller repeat protein [Candidatus Thermoplasmatota archaeon]